MADAGSGNSLRGRDLVGLGGMLAGSVIAGTGLGYLADRAADSSPAFTLLGLALGIAGGVVGFWARVREALGPSDHGEDPAPGHDPS